jgi:hypothetical protein
MFLFVRHLPAPRKEREVIGARPWQRAGHTHMCEAHMCAYVYIRRDDREKLLP